MATRQLCWPPAILFYCCSLDRLYSFFSSRPNLRGHLADRHQTLPRVWWWPRSITFGRSEIWVALPAEIWLRKNIKISAWFHDLIANISSTQHHIINWKTALQTMDTPVQTNLIWCTLVHKLWKIRPEFWPTQWAAIRLGIAMLLV